MESGRINFNSEKDVVPGGEVSIVCSMPHKTTESFVVDIDPEIAPSFEVTGLISRSLPGGCGYHMEMASEASIPAEVVAYTKEFHPWKTRSITEGGQIELKVKNVSDRPTQFRAALSERPTITPIASAGVHGRTSKETFATQPLGMTRERIAPGKVLLLTATPTRIFRGLQVVLCDWNDFEIIHMTVGIYGSEHIVYSAGHLSNGLGVYDIDVVAAVDQQILMRVQNVGSEPKVARAVLWGLAADFDG